MHQKVYAKQCNSRQKGCPYNDRPAHACTVAHKAAAFSSARLLYLLHLYLCCGLAMKTALYACRRHADFASAQASGRLTFPWDKGMVLGCRCACRWLKDPAEMIWLICCWLREGLDCMLATMPCTSSTDINKTAYTRCQDCTKVQGSMVHEDCDGLHDCGRFADRNSIRPRC